MTRPYVSGDDFMPAARNTALLPSYPMLAAYFAGKRKHPRPPDLLVIHSASTGDNPARWLHNPTWREDSALRHARVTGWPVGRHRKVVCGDGKRRYLILCPDGLWRRMGGAHISAQSANGDFVQQARLDFDVPHAGGSTFQGRKGVNRRSIGIELPAHEGDELLDQYRALMGELVAIVPSLAFYTTHRAIRKGKTDPVCWSDERCDVAMAGVGLQRG